MDNDLLQVILSAQNALNTLSPATNRYEKVAFLQDKQGRNIGNQLIAIVSNLESLIQSAKSVDTYVKEELGEIDIFFDDDETSFENLI